MKKVDKILFVLICTLVVMGFFIFSSASLGLLSRQGATFASVAFNQITFGIIGGSIGMFLTSQIYYRNWRKWAFYIFITTLVLTAAVFIPHVGFSHGGARRWIGVGSLSIQPGEALKVAFVIYMATYLSGIHKKIHTFREGTLPFMAITAGASFLLLLQPDTDTFLLMAVSAVAMFVVAGGRWRDIGLTFLIGVLLLTGLVILRPYLMDRYTVFLHPADDPLGKGYQIQQTLIAVGSGGLIGRGFGQSIQKFQYLPEPIGDSIFAVFAEEFGFLGSVILIALMTSFTFRGYVIAAQAPDLFGMLLVVGIITFIYVQMWLNIAAMIAIAPLMGLTLPFISHGGTSLFSILTATGIILNVSKHGKVRTKGVVN